MLVAPHLALTAAHCLTGLDPAESHLLLGYDRGQWSEHLQPVSLVDLGQDLAALCLGEPARTAPLALAREPPAPGETLLAAGYGSPVVHRLHETPCPVGQASAEGGVRLGCPLAPGNSGAPLLRRGSEGDEVVAIAVASNATQSLAIGTSALALERLCNR